MISPEDIDEKMKRDGFPEMELLWRRFRKGLRQAVKYAKGG